MTYYYWYTCPNCQINIELTNGDVCQFCGKLITLDKYEQDDESRYQQDPIDPIVKMKIIYSNQLDFTGSEEKSLFLVGPTSRSVDVPSWRPRAIEILRTLNFNGIVLVPEPSTGEKFPHYENQVEWEYAGLHNCGIIVAWLPRNMENMLGLTTNCELGYWLSKNPKKVFYGRPDGAPHTRYFDWLYMKECNRQPEAILENLISIAIK